MPFYNAQTQEITCKIVYWGPGLSGKSANLQWLHAHAPKGACGKLAELATETERTAFFDFLPLTLGPIGGVATRFHLYTVPGQVYYQAGRRSILRGADGVIFVADAREERLDANLEAMVDLHAALAACGRSLAQIPHVFQYNWSDSAEASTQQALQPVLNSGRAPYVVAQASIGLGVQESLHLAAIGALGAGVAGLKMNAP